MKIFLFAVWEVLEVVLVAVVTVFVIRTFLVQPFLVSGASMEPNFGNGNYLLIDEVSYRFREPERGEVVVFRYPDNPSVYYIKRLIGLPGEEIKVRGGNIGIVEKSGSVLELKENYLSPGLMTTGNLVRKLGASEYFVMGDNRNYSFDSRSWGPLEKKFIIGLVRLRLLPVTKAQAFSY